jgi:hypothetical protein
MALSGTHVTPFFSPSSQSAQKATEPVRLSLRLFSLSTAQIERIATGWGNGALRTLTVLGSRGSKYFLARRGQKRSAARADAPLLPSRGGASVGPRR